MSAPPEKPRLVEGWGPELQQTAMAERTSPLVARLFSAPMARYDLAHAIMLVEQQIVPAADGRTLLSALLRMPHNIPFDDSDLLSARERWLVERLGPQVGGRLHTGRSRGETYNGVLPRMVEREALLVLLECELDLANAVCRLAGQHVESVMPGYSHLRHAQPTTLAHYLLSFAFPIFRNVERGLQAYARTNQSPAGAGIFAGSTYPIDRQRLADLLGFDGVLPNTRDAVWSEDHTLDALLVANQTMTAVARLAQDLEIWSTHEFRMLELADRHSSSSSIMPQKKNPYALEYLRGLSATLHASLVMALSLLKAPSEELDLMIFQPRLFEALEQAARAATLAARVVDGLSVDTRRMAELAATDFATATDLADRLSQRHGLAFRTTHRIVGTAIRLAANAPLTPELIDAAARDVTGTPLAISRDELDRWLDVTAAVAGRSLEGGPAPHAVRAQLRLADTLRVQSLADVQQRRSALATADKRLGERARALADQA